MEQRYLVEAQLRELFNKSKSGDSVAYESFLTLVGAMVRKYLSYLDRGQSSKDLLADLEQEVLMSVHMKKQTYQEDKPILPWIYAITRHRFIDFCRHKKRTPVFVELHDQYGYEDAPIIQLDDILGMLTPREKEMLVLVKVEGYGYGEAADRLKMNESALKVRVHRLLKKIRGDHE